MKTTTNLTKEQKNKLNRMLSLAIAKGDLKTVKEQLDMGADPNTNININWDQNFRKTFPQLSFRGIKKPDPFSLYTNPLMLAVHTDDTAIMQTLINAGAITTTSEKFCEFGTKTVKSHIGLDTLLKNNGYRLSKSGKICKYDEFKLNVEESL